MYPIEERKVYFGHISEPREYTNDYLHEYVRFVVLKITYDRAEVCIFKPFGEHKELIIPLENIMVVLPLDYYVFTFDRLLEYLGYYDANQRINGEDIFSIIEDSEEPITYINSNCYLVEK
jgi:hypothetical protein